METHTILAIAALAATSVCTIPALLDVLDPGRNKNPGPESGSIYQDRDGKSKPEGQAAFSNRIPKTVILLVEAAGLAVALALVFQTPSPSNGLRDSLELYNWLALAGWALLSLQAVSVALARSPVRAHDLGLVLSLSSLISSFSALFQTTQNAGRLLDECPRSFATHAVSVAIGFFSVLAGALLPRRPRVYDPHGRPVDGRRTGTAISRVSFNFAWPVYLVGMRKRDFSIGDMHRPGYAMRADDVLKDWRRHGFEERRTPLWRALLRANRRANIFTWALGLAKSVLELSSRLILMWLIQALEKKVAGRGVSADMWMLVVWYFVLTILGHFANEHFSNSCWNHLALVVRSQLCVLIFDKTVRRKTLATGGGSRSSTNGNSADSSGNNSSTDTNGKVDTESVARKSRQVINNLIGVDVDRLSTTAVYQAQLSMAVGHIVACLLLLMYIFGWPTVLAVTIPVWLAFFPLLNRLIRRFAAMRGLTMRVRDEKAALVGEGVKGARQIKLAGAEARWEERIMAVRDRELSMLGQFFGALTAYRMTVESVPLVLSVASLGFYAWLRGELRPSTAFVGIVVLKKFNSILSYVPLEAFAQAAVSVERIEKYLGEPDREPYITRGPDVAFQHASVSWPTGNHKPEDAPGRFVLRNVDFVCPGGQLTVVCGKTGTGKSLLLAAILGEAELESGAVCVPHPRSPSAPLRHDGAVVGPWIQPGRTAFVSQDPWIENGTVRNNILFGLPLDRDRYERTLTACALHPDLELLPDGDGTELGVNGVNVSGGQKWRVALARAVYSRAEILVLDDIFSAVDVHVGRLIRDRCLTDETLCGGRTRILVTHHVSLVRSRATLLVELAGGTVMRCGPPEALQAQHGAGPDMDSDGGAQSLFFNGDAVAEDPFSSGNSGRSGGDGGGMNSTNGSNGKRSEDPETVMAGGADPTAAKNKTPRKYIEEERREKGSVKYHMYKTYLRYCGNQFHWLVAGSLFILYRVAYIVTTWWLKIWTEGYGHGNSKSATPGLLLMHQDREAGSSRLYTTQTSPGPVLPATGAQHPDLAFYLGIYFALVAATVLLEGAKTYFLCTMSMRASRALFHKVLTSVLRAPLRWLDTTPAGRILNRFTADFDTADETMVRVGTELANEFVAITGLFIACTAVEHKALVAVVLYAIPAVAIAKAYIAAARPCKRLESTTRSPLYELFDSTATGLATIRAFDRARSYSRRLGECVDDYIAASWYRGVAICWLGFTLGLVGKFFAPVVAVLVLLDADADAISAAAAAFALNFAIDATDHAYWVVHKAAQVELAMNTVERLVEYGEMETEDLDAGATKPPAAWPTAGRVEVEDLVAGYAPDLPPVLRGVSFTAEPGKRVGIVGRTGVGKSTLALALFRFLKATSGSIIIDGINTADISLCELRTRLSIIPQDPVLFSGTIRSNLDPYDDHTDAELLAAVEDVHLFLGDPAAEAIATHGSRNATNNAADMLSLPVAERGRNMSQGQRQLVCLARALVSRAKVMVLDEATSAVDGATDARIQRSLRGGGFAGSTLLVVAHRLSTVADFDRIVVMDGGRVAETGTPRELWEAGGYFRGLCEGSGEADKLRAMVYGRIFL